MGGILKNMLPRSDVSHFLSESASKVTFGLIELLPPLTPSYQKMLGKQSDYITQNAAERNADSDDYFNVWHILLLILFGFIVGFFIADIYLMCRKL